jgi:hypothetical protein
MVFDVLIGRGLAAGAGAGAGHVLVERRASLHVARVGRPAAVSICSTKLCVCVLDILDMRVDASRPGPSILLASSRAIGLAVRPLDPAVLVAVEFFGAATEIVGVGLLGHGEYL